MSIERRIAALETCTTSKVLLVTLCSRAEGLARIGDHQQKEGEAEGAFIERARKAMRQATGRTVVVLDAGDADL